MTKKNVIRKTRRNPIEAMMSNLMKRAAARGDFVAVECLAGALGYYFEDKELAR